MTFPLVPAPPTNLSLLDFGGSRVRVQWQDNSINETSFIVERKVGSTGIWGTLRIVSYNTTMVDDDGLTAGIQYCYRVAAQTMEVGLLTPTRRASFLQASR